jgi:uncharacterized protein (TIGR02246 family)
MEESRVRDFAQRYAAAWSSRDPAAVAEFFARQGSLAIDGAAPAVGRPAISDAARGFMSAFPDLRVTMDQLVFCGDRVEFHWTLEGHNTGPGGAGNHVRISGFEQWRFRRDGFIAESQGHFDPEEFARQTGRGRSRE